jgi:hypothetical protein
MLDRKAGGYRIDHIYQADPDYPDERAPLAEPELGVAVGDVITMINGVDVLTAGHPNALLRNQADQQVLLRLKSKATGRARDLVVYPATDEASLRYADWEFTRRQRTDELSANRSGVQSPGADHRCAAQPRRQHRQLRARPIAPQTLDVLAVASGSAVREHAICLWRSCRGAGR